MHCIEEILKKMEKWKKLKGKKGMAVPKIFLSEQVRFRGIKIHTCMYFNLLNHSVNQ